MNCVSDAPRWGRRTARNSSCTGVAAADEFETAGQFAFKNGPRPTNERIGHRAGIATLERLTMGLDLALAVIVLLSAVRGWLKGFVLQAIRLSGIVACVYAADPV